MERNDVGIRKRMGVRAKNMRCNRIGRTASTLILLRRRCFSSFFANVDISLRITPTSKSRFPSIPEKSAESFSNACGSHASAPVQSDCCVILNLGIVRMTFGTAATHAATAVCSMQQDCSNADRRHIVGRIGSSTARALIRSSRA